jgi:hypothetical protein
MLQTFTNIYFKLIAVEGNGWLVGQGKSYPLPPTESSYYLTVNCIS